MWWWWLESHAIGRDEPNALQGRRKKDQSAVLRLPSWTITGNLLEQSVRFLKSPVLDLYYQIESTEISSLPPSARQGAQAASHPLWWGPAATSICPPPGVAVADRRCLLVVNCGRSTCPAALNWRPSQHAQAGTGDRGHSLRGTYPVQSSLWCNYRAIQLKKVSKNSEKNLECASQPTSSIYKISGSNSSSKKTNLDCIWTITFVRKFELSHGWHWVARSQWNIG